MTANDCKHGRFRQWRFYWDAHRVDGYWREYGVSTCSFDLPRRCTQALHVATGDGDAYIALGSDIPLPRLRELVGALTVRVPEAVAKSVNYVPVSDGTRWSAERFGYEVAYREPGDYEGEVHTTQFVGRCADEICEWLARPEPFYSGVTYGQSDGCSRFAPDDSRAYVRLQAEIKGLIATPPSRVVACHIRTFDPVYLARYPALERFGDWTEDAEIQCAVEDLEQAPVAACQVSTFARTAHEAFGVGRGMALATALAVREIGRREAAAGEAVVSVGYQLVSDGGAWSARADGYEVGIGRSGGGRYLRVVERCTADGGCRLEVLREAFQTIWNH